NGKYGIECDVAPVLAGGICWQTDDVGPRLGIAVASADERRVRLPQELRLGRRRGPDRAGQRLEECGPVGSGCVRDSRRAWPLFGEATWLQFKSLDHARGDARPDPFEQLQDPEPADR